MIWNTETGQALTVDQALAEMATPPPADPGFLCDHWRCALCEQPLAGREGEPRPVGVPPWGARAHLGCAADHAYARWQDAADRGLA